MIDNIVYAAAKLDSTADIIRSADTHALVKQATSDYLLE